MEYKNLDDKVKIKLVNHIDDTYQDLWEGPLRGCLSEIEKAYNWDYYIEEETFPKEIDDRFILVVPNNKFDFTTNEFIGFINDLGVLNITPCPEGPSGRHMSETIISTRCVECGSDTGRMGGGFVNRTPSDGGCDNVDAYNCGRCQENIDYYIFGDSAYENCESDEDVDAVDQARQNDPDWAEEHCNEEAYDRYLEERIEEVDKQDPGARPFRELVQSIKDR